MAMEISRRSFLKGAAATGVVAALSSIGISAAAEEAAAADESVKSYLPQEKYDIAEERDFDVVVVGAGGGGMSAAIRAAQLGLSTVLLEQRSVTGGTTLFTEGLFAVNSHIQKENGKNPPDLGYDLFTTAMDYHHWYADGALFRRYMDKSGENIAWLESVGVEFQGTGTMCDNVYNTWHQYKYEEGQISGRTYVDNLTKAVTEAGATLVLGSEGVNIIQAEDGTVTGIIAKEEDKYIQYNAAKGVILATGGYSDNPDMIREFGKNPDRTASTRWVPAGATASASTRPVRPAARWLRPPDAWSSTAAASPVSCTAPTSTAPLRSSPISGSTATATVSSTSTMPSVTSASPAMPRACRTASSPS